MTCTKIKKSFHPILMVPTIFLIFLSYQKSKTSAETFGLGMFNNYNRQHDYGTNFFELISRVPISIFDVAAMYQNISSTANTKNCHGLKTCRTPVALWVLHSLSPCHDITKEDCPIGLVCCHFSPETSIIVINNNELKRSDLVPQATEEVEEWNEDEFDPSAFRQDPIPGDSY